LTGDLTFVGETGP